MGVGNLIFKKPILKFINRPKLYIKKEHIYLNSGSSVPFRAMNSKGSTWGLWGHNFKLKLDILELQKKIKKKVLGVFNGSFETYTRCFEVVDNEKKKL